MSNTIVANELLAFLQQKLDVMDEVSAIQIGATIFSEDDIAAAKLLVFQLLNKSDQMVSRHRDGTKKSLQDIITLLKKTDPDDVPTFVAKELHKFPPVTFDHVDVTSLLKDIVYLKASLAEVERKLDASHITVTDLRTDLEELRKSVPIIGSSVGLSNVNTRRGACLTSASTSAVSYASAVLSQAPIAEFVLRTATASHSPAPATAAPPLGAARNKRPVKTVTASNPVALVNKTASVKIIAEDNEDDFVTVQRRKRKVPMVPKIKVRAAAPSTPVYISRLHYTTEADDIVKYVSQKLKYAPRVQLLESRRNVNFKAFVVQVPNCYLPTVLHESFWPPDVVFRRFRGPVPLERTKT